MKKLIGKGAFSRAYQISENTVELHSSCPTKECYSMFSQNNPLAPKIEKNGFNRNNKPVYIMPLYPKVKALSKQFNSKSLALYKALKDWGLMGINYYAFGDAIRYKNEQGIISNEDCDNLLDLADDVCNGIDPQNMRFEISPRNVTHDKDGNLILLDCFFCIKTLKTTRGF